MFNKKYMYHLLKDADGKSEADKVYNLAVFLRDEWLKINDRLIVSIDHPHYIYIVHTVLHDGNQTAGLISNWLPLRGYKDETVWQNKVYEYCIKLLEFIYAAEYILDKEGI